LTTKDQKLISREPRNHHHKPATPQKGTTNPRHRSRFIFLEIASYKRCSRPLCSSQTTTPYTTPHTHKCMIGGARKPETQVPEPPQPKTAAPPVLLPQDPTVCQTRNHPDPPPHRSKTPSKRTSVLGVEKTTRPLFVDIPPMSTRRRTIVCATGLYS
jgi:hypothetical protein